MLIGAHAILMSPDPEADRAFLRDVLELPFVEDPAAGTPGWLIFALPPAELAIHPGGEPLLHAGGRLAGCLLHLICDDLDATVASLAARGVVCEAATEQSWGRATAIPLPSGAAVGLYEPRHPLALRA